jgi:hypothetical protein
MTEFRENCLVERHGRPVVAAIHSSAGAFLSISIPTLQSHGWPGQRPGHDEEGNWNLDLGQFS